MQYSNAPGKKIQCLDMTDNKLTDRWLSDGKYNNSNWQPSRSLAAARDSHPSTVRQTCPSGLGFSEEVKLIVAESIKEKQCPRDKKLEKKLLRKWITFLQDIDI